MPITRVGCKVSKYDKLLACVCEKKQRCFHTRCRVRCTRKRKNEMKKGCFQNYGNNLPPSIIFRAVPVQETRMKCAQTSVWRAVRCKKHKNLYVKNRNRNGFLVAVIFCCFALSAFTIALYTHCFFQIFFYYSSSMLCFCTN